MPERVLVNNEFDEQTVKKQDDAGNLTVDSQYVIDKLEEAEMQEKQKKLAVDSMVTIKQNQSQVVTPSSGKDGKVYMYQMFAGVRNYWCKGKLQTGPNTRNLIIVTLLINVTNAISLGFSWVVSYLSNLWHEQLLCFKVRNSF